MSKTCDPLWPKKELDQLRADTPGVVERIHFNNAGAALPPRSVVDRIIEHLVLESRIGGYEAADAKAETISNAYRLVGKLVGVEADQIAFVENATAAYAQALSSIPFQCNDVILTSEEDYTSNQIMFLSLVKRFGIQVERIVSGPGGGIELGDLQRRLQTSPPRLLALAHVPTNSGLVQPVAEAGKLAREANVLYLVDVCQSVGQLSVDLEAFGADFLTTTSRKFLRGPRGFGFMAVSRRVLDQGLEPLFIDMQGAIWTEPDRYVPVATAARFENWEFAYALMLGTAEAARYALEIGIDRIVYRTSHLAELLRQGLKEAGLRVLDRGSQQCGIVTIEVPGVESKSFLDRLRANGLNVSISLLEYAQIDFAHKNIEWALRLSPHYYNTEDEVNQAIGLISSTLSKN